MALRFVLIVGIVNLFADFTYEGARSITGPFLSMLGASAAVVGAVAGFGELAGYALRSVSGYLADKTHRYWATAFIGYAINMIAVPLLALEREATVEYAKSVVRAHAIPPSELGFKWYKDHGRQCWRQYSRHGRRPTH